MRWIPVLFSLSACPLIGGEPTEAVLAVLEKLKSENQQPGIPEGVELSSFAGPKIRASLNEAWNQRAFWVKSERVEFFEGFEKVDGNLSAVLVGARSADNPEEVEMMAFGAKLEDDGWKLGPVEGRFASMGLGFDQGVKIRAGALEQWMATERVMAADRLKKQSMDRFKEKMAKLVDPELLKSAKPREVMEHFLAAAKAGRVDELLVWQGILEREDHDEIPWDEIIYITRLGMKNQDEQNFWRLINKPGVMQVILDGEEDDDEKAMLVSFLAGYRTGRDNKNLRPVIFKIRNSPAGWRINLPAYFAKANEDRWDHWRAHQREVHFRDEVNTERMASIFEEENPALRPDKPEEILDKVALDLFDGEIKRSLLYLYRDPPGEDLPEKKEEPEEPKEEFEDEGDEEKADPDEVLIDEDEVDPEINKIARYRAIATWWTNVTGNRKGIRVGNRKIYRTGDLALGILEILPEDRGWMSKYHWIWMSKGEDGWMILPGEKAPFKELLTPELEKERAKLTKEAKGHEEQMEGEHLSKLFKSVSVASDGKEAVPEEAALATAKKWRNTVVGGDIPEILNLSGIRKAPDEPLDILKNLTFLVKGAAVAQVPDQVLGNVSEGRLRGISMMVDGGRGISMDCPLLIVVSTKNGPRVLLDTELQLTTNKGKKFRNDNELKKLEKEMSKEDFGSLKKLVEWHEKTARPVWDEWNGALKAQQEE